jgi:hypothetical protein
MAETMLAELHSPAEKDYSPLRQTNTPQNSKGKLGANKTKTAPERGCFCLTKLKK